MTLIVICDDDDLPRLSVNVTVYVNDPEAVIVLDVADMVVPVTDKVMSMSCPVKRIVDRVDPVPATRDEAVICTWEKLCKKMFHPATVGFVLTFAVDVPPIDGTTLTGTVTVNVTLSDPIGTPSATVVSVTVAVPLVVVGNSDSHDNGIV